MTDAVRGSDASLSPETGLELAGSFETPGQHGDALLSCYRAIIEAQRHGRWLDKATTAAPHLMEAEREPVAARVTAMGDFNGAAGL